MRIDTRYLYDFGDHWEHLIVVEQAVPRESISDPLPMCVDGERACPPEDVGGAHGYTEFLMALSDPYHPEHKQWRRWAGPSFDPTAFDLDRVNRGWPATAHAVPAVPRRPRAAPPTDRGRSRVCSLGRPGSPEEVGDLASAGPDCSHFWRSAREE